MTETAFNASGGSGSAVITTGPACRWSLTVGDSPWIKTEPVTFTGRAVVAVAVDPNRSFDARAGLLQIRDDKGAMSAGQMLTQRGAGCLYTIAPGRLRRDWLGTSDGSDVGAFEARIHTEPSDCRWTATSTVPWMSFPRFSQTSGTGDGHIFVSISWNSSPETRVGDIVIAGLSGVNPDGRLIVTQTGR